MAKHYAFGKLSFFRHQALKIRVQRFEASWAISLRPAFHFTVDGRRPWEGEAARSYAIRARAEQYNNAYLNDVLFWTNQLSRGERVFALRVGDEQVATVSGTPLIAQADFTVRPANRPIRRRF